MVDSRAAENYPIHLESMAYSVIFEVMPIPINHRGPCLGLSLGLQEMTQDISVNIHVATLPSPCQRGPTFIWHLGTATKGCL